MRRVLVLLLLLAACSETPGMRLEVTAGSTGAVRVEVYIALRLCATPECQGGIAAAMAQGKLGGPVWFLDGSAADGTPAIDLPIDGGSAVVELQSPAPDKDVRLPYVIAVGYDAQGQIVAAARMEGAMVPHDRTEWVRLELQTAAGQPSSDDTTQRGVRVWVWHRADRNKAACVGYERASGAEVDRLWFVPEDDPDCDELAPECDGLAYHAMNVSTLGNANCTAVGALDLGDEACMLGGPGCVDGVAGTDANCLPTNPTYCIPDGYCDDITCKTNPIECDGGAHTYVDCVFPVGEGPQRWGMENQTDFEIDLGPLFAHDQSGNPGTHCTEIKLAALSIGAPQTGSQLEQDGFLFSRKSVMTDPCSFHLSFDAVAAAQPPPTPPYGPLHGVVVAQLSNGKTLLVPLLIKLIAGTCDANSIAVCGTHVAPNGDGLLGCTR